MMITLDILDNRLVELTDELKRIEGSIKENRAMRNWLDAEIKKKETDEMACSTGKGKGVKKPVKK